MDAEVDISQTSAQITNDNLVYQESKATSKRQCIDEYFTTNGSKGEKNNVISIAPNPFKVQKTQLENGQWSCKNDKCYAENDDDMLTCSQCNSRFHYRCTDLPPYQVTQFISKGYQKYQCASCIIIPDNLLQKCILDNDTNDSDPASDKYREEIKSKCKIIRSLEEAQTTLQELINDKDTLIANQKEILENLQRNDATELTKGISMSTQTTSTWKTYEQLTAKIDNRENELQKKTDELQRVYDEKNKQRNENLCMKQKLETLEEHQETLRNHIKTKDTLLDSMKNYTKINNDNKVLQQQVKQLRDQDEIHRKLLEKRDEKNKEVQTITTNPTNDKSTTKLSEDIQKLINERFDTIEKNIDKLVTRKITESSQLVQVEKLEAKLDEVIINNKSYAETVNNYRSEATNLANVIKESKNDDLVREKDRENRSANFIIYGVDEVSENESRRRELH